jgi:hypothetical protein
MKRLILALSLATFVAGPVLADTAPPAAAPPPQAKQCSFPDTAVVTLNVNKGDVDALLVMLQRGTDGMTMGQYKALNATITLQVQDLQAKYCK